MITSVNELLYDNQAITDSTGTGNCLSSEYTWADLSGPFALSQPGVMAWITIQVTEAFDNFTTGSISLQNKIGGAGWATIEDLNMLVVRTAGLITVGTFMFDGPMTEPIGLTGANGLETKIRFKFDYAGGSAPTAGRLNGWFATEAGIGTMRDFQGGAGTAGDANVAAIQIPAGAGITR